MMIRDFMKSIHSFLRFLVSSFSQGRFGPRTRFRISRLRDDREPSVGGGNC